MRSIFWSSIKAFAVSALALFTAPAAAQYFDIYGEGNRTLPAAQSAFDAMPENASDEVRAQRISDLIMGLIGKAKYREAFELYLANQDLDLHPDAKTGAIGHGLVAFTPDEAQQAVYVTHLLSVVERESCAPCYARTFAAHHLARYFFLREDDLAKSLVWHKRALDTAKIDLAANDPAKVNFAYQYGAYLRRQDLQAAAVAARETEALALELLPRDDHLGWLYVFLNRALVALEKGQIAEAADLFSRIADIGVKEWGPDDPQLLSIYQNNAILLSRLGRTQQAVEVALRAESAQGYSDEREFGYQQALVARLLFEDARPDEAVTYYRRALETFDGALEEEIVVARAQVDLANVLSIAAEHDEALTLTDDALSTYEKLEITNPERRVRQMLAALNYARAGQPGRAAAIMAPVLEFNENALLDVYARDQDRRAIASDGTEIFRDSMVIALLNGDRDRAWRSAQLSVISDLAMSAAALSYPGDAAGFSDALDEVRLTRTAESDARTALANGEGSSEALAEASERREAAELRLRRDYPDFAEYLRPRPLSIDDAQALLRDDEAYILPMVYADRVVTIALTADGFAWGQSTTPLHGTRERIKRLRASLEAGLSGEDSFDAQAAFQLYASIFTEEIEGLVADGKRLIFPAGGPLAVIPPSVLVKRPPSAGVPHFLIRDHAVAITPGLGQRMRDRRSGVRRFAGIGAPNLAPPPANRAALRGAVVDVDSIKALPSLPGAQRELAALQAAFAVEETLILSGDEATERAVRAAPLAEFQILAFSTHGLVSGQIAGLTEPALVLTPEESETAVADNDGLLTASEIARLSLAADWVILSACNTAAGEGTGEPTFSGLARAFQLAGARSLLLSHWPVRDDAATRLSVATVTGSSAGMDRSEALREAQLALIEDADFAGGASPSIWAPFVLIE